MLTVYGAEWCEDTQRSLRYLRRLRVPYEYLDVDADPAVLDRAKALNHGRRRTPVVQVHGEVLVEPGIATLTEALIRNGVVDRQEASDRIHRRNVGDLERGIKIGAGGVITALSMKAPKGLRIPLLVLGAYEVITGALGWCPVYKALGITSLGGPMDHPVEAERRSWFTREPEWTGREPRPATDGGTVPDGAES